MSTAQQRWAPQAWVRGGWQPQVLLEVDRSGHWHQVRSGVPQLGLDATAARLFNRLLAGSAAAAGFSNWGLVAGARADLLVLDPSADGLAGVPASHALDALVFATDAPAFREVWVAGRRQVAGGRHLQHASLRSAHAAAMAALWPTGCTPGAAPD